MKRMLMLLLIGCIVICAFGCEKKDSDCPPMPVSADSLEELFECLVIAKTGEYEKDKHNNKSSYAAHRLSEINVITVPNFNYEEYELKSVSIYEDQTYYTYYGNGDISSDYIQIMVSRIRGSFEAYMFKKEIEPVDGKYYDSLNNTWYIECNRYLVSVIFPQKNSAENFEFTEDVLSFTRYKVTETGVTEENK